MGIFLYSIRTHRDVHLLLSLLLLSSTHFRYSAEGIPLFQLLEIAKEGDGEETAMIGSRPPRCEGMCSSCGHCEAVQVPVVPQDRGDGSTNYKPLSWKCKCGGIILNP